MPQRAAVLACLILLAACAGTDKPKLANIDAGIPAGVRLDGLWRLRGEPGEPEPDPSLTGRDGIVLPPQGAGREGRQKSSAYPSVHVFLEFGRTLKITQTEYGLFISFDRAIVEEYRFREHRMVNVGPIRAERVSGWEAGGYVVRTIDEKDALLTEKYSLEDDGNTLLRTVRIDYRNETRLMAERRFDRVE